MTNSNTTCGVDIFLPSLQKQQKNPIYFGRGGLEVEYIWQLRPISLLRFVDSNFPANSLWAWEFHS